MSLVDTNLANEDGAANKGLFSQLSNRFLGVLAVGELDESSSEGSHERKWKPCIGYMNSPAALGNTVGGSQNLGERNLSNCNQKQVPRKLLSIYHPSSSPAPEPK